MGTAMGDVPTWAGNSLMNRNKKGQEYDLCPTVIFLAQDRFLILRSPPGKDPAGDVF